MTILALARTAGAVCNGDCAEDGEVDPPELRRITDIVNLCGGNPDGCPEVPGTDKQCANADVDANGNITAADVTRIIADNVIGENEECQAAMGLGTRVFTVAQSSGFNPASGFFSTGGGGSEVTTDGSWYVSQPINLRAGPVDPVTGIASIRLEQDAIFGARVVMGGPTLCIKLFAAGSTGQLDCDGGSPQDVLFTVDSNFSGDAGESMVTPYTGVASEPGDLTLEVMATVDNISPALPSAADCVTHEFGDPSLFFFTTARATTLVVNAPNTTAVRNCSLDTTLNCNDTNMRCPTDKGTCTVVELSRDGRPFNCATWTQTNSGGRLVTSLFGEDTQVGDTANILLVGDN